MKESTKKALKQVKDTDANLMGDFIKILETPNGEFKLIAPFYKEHITSIYRSKQFQENMLNEIQLYGGNTASVESELEDLNELIEALVTDETLSDEKKDVVLTMKNEISSVFRNLVESGRISIDVKVLKAHPDAIIPYYANPTDAGCDVSAVEEVKIEPGETKIVNTGLIFAIPAGYEIQVRPRSGLSYKTGLRVANAPGTIDADYRGVVGVIMTNTGDIPYVIEKGMRIAQLVIAPTLKIRWSEAEKLEDLGSTNRGEGGFGSTGSAANAG